MTEDLRSNIFQRLETASDIAAFKDGLRDFLNLQASAWQIIVSDIPLLLSSDPTNAPRRNALFRDLVQIEGEKTVENSLQWLIGFTLDLESTAPLEDTPQIWQEDLQKLGFTFSDAEASRLHELHERIRHAESDMIEVIRRREYEVGVLPFYASVSTTVDLRGVPDPSHGFPLTSVVSHFKSLVPIISVHMTLDAGNPDEVYFQGTVSNIKDLIEDLSLAVQNAETLLSQVELKTSDKENP